MIKGDYAGLEKVSQPLYPPSYGHRREQFSSDRP